MKPVYLLAPLTLTVCFASFYFVERLSLRKHFDEIGPGRISPETKFHCVGISSAMLSTHWEIRRKGLWNEAKLAANSPGRRVCASGFEIHSEDVARQVYAALLPKDADWKRGGAPRSDAVEITLSSHVGPSIRLLLGYNFVSSGEYWRQTTPEFFQTIETLVLSRSLSDEAASAR